MNIIMLGMLQVETTSWVVETRGVVMVPEDVGKGVRRTSTPELEVS